MSVESGAQSGPTNLLNRDISDHVILQNAFPGVLYSDVLGSPVYV